jgi:hypothetical protein
MYCSKNDPAGALRERFLGALESARDTGWHGVIAEAIFLVSFANRPIAALE